MYFFLIASFQEASYNKAGDANFAYLVKGGTIRSLHGKGDSFVISKNPWCDTLRPCKHPVSQQPFIQWLPHKPYLIKYYLRSTKW